jgi:hypothetical protein
MSLPPNIYVPLGHGDEELAGEKPVIPPGCQLVVLAQCKRPVSWLDEQNAEQLHIKNFIATNPARVGIFADPVHHRREINAAVGSVCAFYTAGDEYPDILYTLDLSWKRPASISLRYSGVVPFTTYSSNEAETGFTTRDIYKQLYPGGRQQMYMSPNPREIYRYSVFPRPQEFPTPDSTEAQLIEFLLQTKDARGVSPTQDYLQGLSKEQLYGLSIDAQFYGSYERIHPVRLSTLMAQMPGVYYHLVCRGDSDTLDDEALRADLPRRRRNSFVRRRLPGLTRNDIFGYIRKPAHIRGIYNKSETGIKPQFLYENARDVLGPYAELPENIRAAFNNSRRFLLQGGRRTYKQRRGKRKTRRVRQ